MTTELCRLAQKYNVDKCPHVDSKYPTHTYTPQYHAILNSMRDSVKSILEIGIGNNPLMDSILNNYKPGASLRMWRDYFPHAKIYACDILKEVLFRDDRIACFQCDQNSVPSLINLCDQIQIEGGEKQFDIILDDGSHQKEHQNTSFVTLWNFVKPGGVYIIEDVHSTHLDFFSKLPEKMGFNNAEIVQVHRGDWDGDNFIAYRKV
jgi:hypothetical protein